MFELIVKRILQAIPVLLIVITGSFFLIRLAPGDPFSQEKALPVEVLKSLKQHYNLDKPLYIQYIDYIGDLLHGDFGPSFKYPGRTVTEIIGAGMPVTFELGLY